MKITKKMTTLLLILAVIAGIAIMLYPTISDYWNSMHQSRAIAQYSEEVKNLNKEDLDKIWKEAREYNKSLAKRTNLYGLTDEQAKKYPDTLKVGSSDAMGYIEIPSIKVSLPIYHGTNDDVLQTSVGHIDWTSLPVGGVDSHSVVSGHRGLPSAKLFSDLDEITVGDVFIIQVLDKTLTYEVDQIKIVEPQQATDLIIEKGKDLCTLVTCTPYGVNTHRLLVRGHRVSNRDDSALAKITSEASVIDPMIVAPILAIPMLIALVIFVLLKDRRKNRAYKEKEEML